jgi:hypothetical protein
MQEATPQEVEAFIAERCVDLRCPACGSPRIEPAAECEGKPIALLYEGSAARSWFGPPGYLRVLALTCMECSYVVMFRLDALEKWLRARKTKKSAVMVHSAAASDASR